LPLGMRSAREGVIYLLSPAQDWVNERMNECLGKRNQKCHFLDRSKPLPSSEPPPPLLALCSLCIPLLPVSYT
jgi:hypothetical protein